MHFNFDTFPTLKTDKILLRECILDDAKMIFELRSNEEINKYVGSKRVENIEEACDFILDCKKLYSVKKRVFWVIELQKEIIGSIVFHKISLKTNYAEIGYKLKPEFQKKGIMSQTFKTVLEFGFNNMNLKTIEAFTHKNNIDSISLLKRHRFKLQKERKCDAYDFNRIYKLDK